MFNQVVVVDWSSAGVPKTGRDSIWIGVAGDQGVRAENIPTRALAEARLTEICTKAGPENRILIGVDFGLGYPRGFAKLVAGQPGALALWQWLTARVTDTTDNDSNFRDVAGAINTALGGGPFWGDARRVPTKGLPRRRAPVPDGIAAHRATEFAARDGGAVPKSMWQLAYAGAVGAQSLTGIPMVHRIRQTLPGARAWPFEPHDTAQIVLAEVYPSLVARLAEAGGYPTKDAAQVCRLALALFRLGKCGDLARLFEVPDVPHAVLQEEGWILGAGHAALLRAALDR